MKNKRDSFPLVGGSSLMVIFAVLCLTVFALLSLNTSEAGERLSQKNATAVSSYYKADTMAEEILAELRLGNIPNGVTVDGNIYSYACPISETQELDVKVIINGTDYTILSWKCVSTTDWEADNNLNVWDGN